ncbi:hypothetical protein JL721_3732 [Aureococcus anophagefferens]|nr:hypothetical protein JL721_3732 [Aureococcus anophagefferens]
MIASLRASILRGDATATSLAAAAVAAAREPWNDFVRVDEARAAATSRRLDAGARKDAPLFGVPFAAKANLCATSVGDAEAVLRVIAGADGLDATCVDAPVEDYAGLLAAPSNFRVAAVAEASDLATLTLPRRPRRARPWRRRRVLPWLRDACAAYYVLSASEAFGNLSRYAHVDRPRTAEAWRRVDHAPALRRRVVAAPRRRDGAARRGGLEGAR